MKVAVFGASGRTGRLVVEELLARGHEVVAISRSPRADVHWRRADVRNPVEVRAALTGSDAAIVCLGPTEANDRSCGAGTRHIVEGMRALGIERLSCQTGAMIGHPPQLLGWLMRRMRSAFRARRPQEAADRDEQERVVRESGLAHTLVRPARLTGGPATAAV